jgi:serine/threonine-protein kinase
MTFAAGTRLGVYEITGLIGVGGMGEVYRATDTTLGREVAIKTLPRELARDADRLARFEREAKLLAALNHSHIAAVYGLHEHEGTRFLAMELVDGETLDKKSRGSLTVEQALRLALQIAEALEAAHEKGVVHRDLKPANVMVTRDGQVKVLDFGLAKAFVGDPTATMPAHSPALSLAMTQQGFVLGTAAYMSPEQASGQSTDQRADIWAFGVVLFELLAGSPLFGGESVPHILADVLRSEPDWTRLPKDLHPRLRLLLERCLEKNARNRYHSIADVRVDIEKVLSDPLGLTVRPEERVAVARQSLMTRFAIGLALASIGALIATGAAWRLWPARDVQVARFSVDLAGPLGDFGSVAISPDGRRIVYASNGQLYSQRLDQDEPTTIPGSEQGSNPFFSPDGESVAFFTRTQLKTARFAGEVPRVLANIDLAQGLVGAWDEQGRIFFGQAGLYGLSWVQARGGVPEPFAALGDYKDMDYPDVLPGGQWVLFSADNAPADWSGSDIVAQNTSTGERKVVLKGGHFARYLPTGHLVFARRGTLYAVAFDTKRLEAIGRVVPIVQQVATDETSGIAQYAVASSGTLVYAQGGATTALERRALLQANREGVLSVLSTELRNYSLPRVSPDGLRLAVEVKQADSHAQIWIMDVASGAATQLTFDGDENRFPVWTRDGREVLFTSKRDGKFAIYRKAADGAGEAVHVLDGTDALVPTDVLPGNLLLYQDTGAGGLRDILTIDLEHPGAATPFLATAADEFGARASPNGAWIAYTSCMGSCNSGRVYVRPYASNAGGQRAVSEGPGIAPVWSRKGDEIFFIGPPPGHMMAVAVQTTPTTITPGRPLDLFDFGGKLQIEVGDILSTAVYDIAPNGDGFVGAQQPGSTLTGDAGAAARPKLRVVLNWFEELKKLVPTH